MCKLYLVTYPLGNAPKISISYLSFNCISVDITVATTTYMQYNKTMSHYRYVVTI